MASHFSALPLLSFFSLVPKFRDILIFAVRDILATIITTKKVISVISHIVFRDPPVSSGGSRPDFDLGNSIAYTLF